MTQIKNSAGLVVYPQEGGSALIQIAFRDAVDSQLAKAAIQTVTVTLVDVVTGGVINSRSNQSVLDANGGTMATDGSLDLILGPLDNIIVTAGRSLEEHRIDFEWTWLDAGANQYTGKESYFFSVESAGNGASGDCRPWIG